MYYKLDETVSIQAHSFGIFLQLRRMYKVGLADPLTVYILTSFNGTKTVEQVIESVSDLIKKDMEYANILVERVFGEFSGWLNIVPEGFKPSKPTEQWYSPSLEKQPIEWLDGINPEEFSSAKKNGFRLPMPAGFLYLCTTHCPVDCRYCYVDNKNRLESYLPIERLRLAIDESVAGGTDSVLVTGGDPLVKKDILRIFEEFASKGFYVEFSTKSHIDTKMARELSRIGVAKVQVSIDAYSPEIQDFLCGVDGTHEGMINSIRNCISEGLYVQTNSVLTSHNISEIANLTRFLLKEGVRAIVVAPVGMALRKLDRKLKISSEQAERAEKELIQLSTELPHVDFSWRDSPIRHYRYNSPVVDFSSLEEILSPNDYIEKVRTRLCGAYRVTAAILPDGSITGCERMLDIGDEVIIGNITTQSLSDIWNSDKAKTLAFPSEDLYVNSPCHGCEDFAFCQAKGMCYVGAKLNFGKIFYPTGHCKVLRGKIVVDR